MRHIHKKVIIGFITKIYMVMPIIYEKLWCKTCGAIGTKGNSGKIRWRKHSGIS